jgi:F-type H+-transporting ATPase subunit delta
MATQAAKRYARAVFQLAEQENRLDPVATDLLSIGALLQQSDDLARFLGNLVIPTEKRAATLRALFGGKVDALTLRFLLFLESKRRLVALPGIIEHLGKLYDEKQGVLNVEITSATQLEPGQFAAIGRKLEDKFKKKIKATAALDPKLLGGFIVQVGGTIYDYSIETQLQTLGKKLVSA